MKMHGDAEVHVKRKMHEDELFLTFSYKNKLNMFMF